MADENKTGENQTKTVKSGSKVSETRIMSYTNHSASVPKLTEKNYLSWKLLITTVLKLKGLDKVVSGEQKVDEISELEAKLLLLETLDEHHLALVRNCDKACEIMTRLNLKYADTSAQNVTRMLNKYLSYKLQPGESMSTHIGKMEAMRSDLENVNQKQSDEMFQVQLLNTLPPEYDMLKEVWETTHPDLKKVDVLISRILKKEEDLITKGAAENSAFVTNRNNYNRTGKTYNNQNLDELKKNSKCAKCGHKGHWAKECRTKPRKYVNRIQNRAGNGITSYRNSNQILSQNHLELSVMVDLCPELKLQWLADSGASAHMCNQKGWFSQIELFETPEDCSIGNGKKVKILGNGKVTVLSKNNDPMTKLNLTNVLYIPELMTNLFSVGAAADKDAKTTFDKKTCLTTLNGQVIVKGERLRGSLYLMNMAAAKADHNALFCQAERTKSEWHRVLGHACDQRINQLMKDPELGLKIVDKVNDTNCSVCPAGKGRHASHPSYEYKRAEEAGDRVHVDLTGKLNVTSVSGCNYYLICKDEWSSYVYTYFVKDKSLVALALAKLICDFEADSGKTIKRIHSDNGSEFVNAKTEMLFAREHIVHETTAPHTPQQNGRVEREIQSITQMARCMLIGSELGQELYAEAVDCATYIQNRLPNVSTDKTPYELIFNRKPYLKHICEFGTEAHVIINGHYLSKFDARTEPGYIVGFTKRRNTYKIYLPQRKRVIMSCDVIFKPHPKTRERQLYRLPDLTREQAVKVSVIPNEQQRRQQVNQGPTNQNEKGQSRPNVQFSDMRPRSNSSGIVRLSERQPEVINIDANTTGQNIEQNAQTSTQTTHEHNQEQFEQPVENPGNITTSNNAEMSVYHQAKESTDELEVSMPTLSEHNSHLDEPELETRANTEYSPFKGRELTRTPPPGSFVACFTPQPVEPRTFEDALQSDDKEKWIEAIEDELKAHKLNETWKEVEKPKGKTLLSTKWVFTIKYKSDNSIERYKARLVARGFEQREGFDFEEVFSPVTRYESIRLLVAIATHYNLQYTQFDVKTAFLYGEIDEELYIETPKGVKLSNNKALKLQKGLYGLKQAPRVWNNKFKQTVEKIGFRATISDPCVFYEPEKRIYLCIYVDDGLLFAANSNDLQATLNYLKEQFDIRVVRGSTFVGLQIEQQANSYTIKQTSYAKQVLKRFNMDESKPVSAPLETSHKLTEVDPNEEDYKCPYREAIGALNFLATKTRPDILHAVTLLAKFCEHPKQKHWAAIKRVMRYIQGTLEIGLMYTKSEELEVTAYSDADFAADLQNRRSITGCIVFISNGPVIFRSIQQSIVALSTTQAEFIAASDTVKEVLWLKSIMSELQIRYSKPKLRSDSQTAINLIKNPAFHKRTKHIDIKYQFIKQCYHENQFKLEFVPTEEQLADYLTKALPRDKHRELIQKCNMMLNQN